MQSKRKSFIKSMLNLTSHLVSHRPIEKEPYSKINGTLMGTTNNTSRILAFNLRDALTGSSLGSFSYESSSRIVQSESGTDSNSNSSWYKQSPVLYYLLVQLPPTREFNLASLELWEMSRAESIWVQIISRLHYCWGWCIWWWWRGKCFFAIITEYVYKMLLLLQVEYYENVKNNEEVSDCDDDVYDYMAQGVGSSYSPEDKVKTSFDVYSELGRSVSTKSCNPWVRQATSLISFISMTHEEYLSDK